MDAGERRGFGAPGPAPACDALDAFGEVSPPRRLSPLLAASFLTIVHVGRYRVRAIGRGRVHA
ncbi:MAG TPA: hypothetical protein VIM15_09595 [Gemmatimonadaceae bacterium]